MNPAIISLDCKALIQETFTSSIFSHYHFLSFLRKMFFKRTECRTLSIIPLGENFVEMRKSNYNSRDSVGFFTNHFCNTCSTFCSIHENKILANKMFNKKQLKLSSIPGIGNGLIRKTVFWKSK